MSVHYVYKVIRTISSQFIFFLRKDFKRTKTQIKPKPTNKTKTSKQKTIKAIFFCAQKVLRGGEVVILRFLKKIEIVLIISFALLLKICGFLLCYYQIASTCSVVLTRLYGLMVRTSDYEYIGLLRMQVQNPARSRFHGCETLTSKEERKASREVA